MRHPRNGFNYRPQFRCKNLYFAFTMSRKSISPTYSKSSPRRTPRFLNIRDFSRRKTFIINLLPRVHSCFRSSLRLQSNVHAAARFSFDSFREPVSSERIPHERCYDKWLVYVPFDFIEPAIAHYICKCAISTYVQKCEIVFVMKRESAFLCGYVIA